MSKRNVPKVIAEPTAKLRLTVGGKVIELTLAQARKLYQELDDLFGRNDDPPPNPPAVQVIPIQPRQEEASDYQWPGDWRRYAPKFAVRKPRMPGVF